ncbi:MAG TPA: asparagine synthase-related protein, partial [Trueperaceae bacterium]
SGGMDSGATVATAGWLRQRGDVQHPRLRTYSFAFEELKDADERHISDLLVRHYGLDAVNVPADDAWPFSSYPELVADAGDPMAIVYQDLIARLARIAHGDGARVIMTSARGDLVVGDSVQDQVGMLLAGRFSELDADLDHYARWRGIDKAGAVRRLLWRQALGEVTTHPWTIAARSALQPRPPRPALNARSQAPWVQRGAVDELVASLETLEQAEAGGPRGPGGSALVRRPKRERRKIIDLPSARKMLEWDERFHARFGLEVTDPWSDRRVAELALAMPQWMVQRHAERKRIARQAMRGIMPEDARTAARKIDPSPLFRRALEDRAVGTISHLLTNMVTADMGLLDEAAVRRHYEDVRSGAPDLPGFWPALTLEAWLRAHHGGA